jgi:hypothetical protein
MVQYGNSRYLIKLDNSCLFDRLLYLERVEGKRGNN